MLIILGKTASGKTTVVKNLCDNGYRRIITYTTRPQRRGESKDAYHFILEEEFLQKINDGFFAEWDSYTTESGEWYYGSALEDYEDADEKTVVILTPNGLRNVQNNDILDDRPTSIYIYANLEAIKSRLLKRGDSKVEIERRLRADNNDFRGVELDVDRIVYNGLSDKMPDVVKKVIDFYEGGSE